MHWTPPPGFLMFCLTLALAGCGGGSGVGADPDPDPGEEPTPVWPPPSVGLPTWEPPACDSIAGPAVAAVSPEGSTLLPNDEPVGEIVTQSIAAVPTWGGQVFAARGTAVFRTQDSGCTWEHVTDSLEPLRLVSTRFPEFTWGLSDRGDTLHVFPRTQISELPFQAIDIAPAEFSTLHALATDGRIMRVDFFASDLFSSVRNVVWEEVGMTPINVVPRFLAINPANQPFEPPNHIVLTTVAGPPMVTFDDGAIWVEASGVRQGAESVRTGRARFERLGPDDPDAPIWIPVARTRTDPDSGEEIEERTIARSIDGGRTFEDVLVDDGETILIEDALFDEQEILSSLSTPGVILFSAGTCPDAEPRLFRYDAADDVLTTVTWDPGVLSGVGSIDIAPHAEDAELLFIGHRNEGECG